MAPEHGLLIGINPHQGGREPVRIPINIRQLHTAIFGATRTGKTTSMMHSILADILHPAKPGVAVIEPHGDLIDDLLARTPKQRVKDVIIFDPTDMEYPIPLNPLHAGRGSEWEKERVAADNVESLRKPNIDSWPITSSPP